MHKGYGEKYCWTLSQEMNVYSTPHTLKTGPLKWTQETSTEKVEGPDLSAHPSMNRWAYSCVIKYPSSYWLVKE